MPWRGCCFRGGGVGDVVWRCYGWLIAAACWLDGARGYPSSRPPPTRGGGEEAMVLLLVGGTVRAGYPSSRPPPTRGGGEEAIVLLLLVGGRCAWLPLLPTSSHKGRRRRGGGAAACWLDGARGYPSSRPPPTRGGGEEAMVLLLVGWTVRAATPPPDLLPQGEEEKRRWCCCLLVGRCARLPLLPTSSHKGRRRRGDGSAACWLDGARGYPSSRPPPTRGGGEEAMVLLLVGWTVRAATPPPDLLPQGEEEKRRWCCCLLVGRCARLPVLPTSSHKGRSRRAVGLRVRLGRVGSKRPVQCALAVHRHSKDVESHHQRSTPLTPPTYPATAHGSAARGGSTAIRISRSGCAPGRPPARTPSAANPPPKSAACSPPRGSTRRCP